MEIKEKNSTLYLQILSYLLPITISQELSNFIFALEDKIRTRMNIRAILDQLTHQFYIRVINTFRISEDFRHVNRHSHLNKNKIFHTYIINLIHIFDLESRIFTWSIRRFGSGEITVLLEKSTRFPDKFPRKRPCFPFKRWTRPLPDFFGCNKIQTI